MYDYDYDFGLDEDKMGMKVTSGVVTIVKDPNTNLIGITIGGGPPNCPCIYIIQISDNSPAAIDGTLDSGDELLAVNNECVRGRTKLQVAQLIQSSVDQVVLKYNKLHADASQGKTLDIILKKVKHRLVERMSSATADSLGMSRAILVNDNLVKRFQQLDDMEQTYRLLVEHTERVLRAFFALIQCFKEFGDAFAEIGAREPQPRASEVLVRFAEYHRQMERQGLQLIKALKPISKSFGTYLNKAIPDTKQTIRKYTDVKFEYLSYCLKVKELDDEEMAYCSADEPLYRLETGNYEYRLVLRCRQLARKRFADLRNDVVAKIELLENKHVHDVVGQLHAIASQLAGYNQEMGKMLGGGGIDGGPCDKTPLFPIEMDLNRSAFQYESVQPPCDMTYELDQDDGVEDEVQNGNLKVYKDSPQMTENIDKSYTLTRASTDLAQLSLDGDLNADKEPTSSLLLDF
ncbi:PRKCA-binding protein [Daktulosphaira vitifoliae]|uniref:PRKCA-binding protein n=1 Tax=Daktulosphaira vitifoliae TaxID=58002 RepID=UPI0021A9FD99|nr:PRKCA-binding protein [Daktulosphaira vitifoliae]XP_050526678.1 PRKCA-binding protein [Daktulosphaira vitifoliae]XP_050526679.1 PRKCA-binding protein [Daktulosphaira vitifoliae]XP_050526680.1 PRKCA-binding protein [Daktulosphaira vitifoliae]XP_050526681.1 PRKCA-binding protein [Daktulosphaira vitifoliae]